MTEAVPIPGAAFFLSLAPDSVIIRDENQPKPKRRTEEIKNHQCPLRLLALTSSCHSKS